MRRALLFLVALAAMACSREEAPPAEGELVTPPFEVRGDAEGLLLVWFDEEGPHVASRRSEIPEARRRVVRVDDLSLPPGVGLGPDEVYVADLSSAGAGGDYPVRRMRREAFDRQVALAAAPPEEPEAPEGPPGDAAEGEEGAAEVVIYGASWCGACRSAAAFLRERHVPFVERDIERDPGAREAMLRAARRAGVSPTGIPVIDFRGEVIQGFDRRALERAIARAPAPI